MDDSSPLTPELRENLVAYLDGELDEVGTLEVERTLTESAEIRQEVEMLARTWDLLDELPPVQASREFTERTLASLQTPSVSGTTRLHFSAKTRWGLMGLGLLAGVLAAAWTGFFLTNQALPQPSDPVVRDLPVLEQLDLYEEIGDAEFLKELERLEELTLAPPSGSSHEIQVP